MQNNVVKVLLHDRGGGASLLGREATQGYI